MKVIRRRNSESSRQLSMTGLCLIIAAQRYYLLALNTGCEKKQGRVVVFWLGFCTGTACGVSGDLPRCNPRPLWLERGNLFFRFDVFTFSPNSVRQVLISLTSRSLFLVLRAAPSPSTQYLSSFLRSTVTPREKVSCKTIASLASLSFPSSRSLVQDIDLKSIRFASLSKKDH